MAAAHPLDVQVAEVAQLGQLVRARVRVRARARARARVRAWVRARVSAQLEQLPRARAGRRWSAGGVLSCSRCRAWSAGGVQTE